MISSKDSINRPSIRELLVFKEVSEAYSILSGGTLGEDDLRLIEKSVGLERYGDIQSLRDRAKFSEKRLEYSLSSLGIKYGAKFLRRDITRNNKNLVEAVSLFIELKRLGFIKETKSGLHRVLSKHEAKMRIDEINKDPRRLEEIIASSYSGWSRDDLLMEAEIHSTVKPYLKYIDNKKILNVLSARIRKRDWRNVEAVLEEIESRLPNLTRRELKELTRELNRLEQVKKGLLDKLMKEKPGLERRLRETSSKTGSDYSNGYSRGMGGAETFFSYVKRYMETGNAGYLDMALSSVDSASNYPLYRKIVDCLENGEVLDVEQLVGLTLKLQLRESIVLLSFLRRCKGYRRFLPVIASRILVETKSGKRDSGKTRYTVQRLGGRIDVRRSVFRLSRNSREFMVYRKRTRRPGVTLLVDTSGSLRGFSGDVLLYSSILSEMINHLIVFSDKAAVYKCGKKCRVEEIISNMDFSGNTDIIHALEEAVTHTPRMGKIIVISDLRHNTSGKNGLIEIVKEILAQRRRITFITVGNVDVKTASALDVIGARVVEPSNPRNLKRVLFKELRSR